MKLSKLSWFKVDRLSLFVAMLALTFSVYQHFRIHEFDKMLKSPHVGFDVMINRTKEWFSVTLVNKGLVPAVMTSTTVNNIKHSSVSMNEIRESIFELLAPSLKNGCTQKDVRYAGYDAGSVMAIGEKSVLFAVEKKNFKAGLDPTQILMYFDKNKVSILYSDFSGKTKKELAYP